MRLRLLLVLSLFLWGGLSPAPCTLSAGAKPAATDVGRSLRMLCIGNSFSLDGTAYLGEMMVDAGIPTDSFGIYCAVKAGASLEYWWQQYKRDAPIEEFLYMGGRLHTSIDATGSSHPGKVTLREVLREPWDVIVVQQCVALSDQPDTFEPYLTSLIQAIRQECPRGKEVTIAWQMVWSKGEASAGGPHGEAGWKRIVETARSACDQAGITTIIPTGTAIQNARLRQAFAHTDALTRDGLHLLYGVGRYLAALTWYETICRPIFALPAPLPSGKIQEMDAAKSPAEPVTGENYALCHRCALDAVSHPFDLTDEEGNLVIREKGYYRILEAQERGVYLINGMKVQEIPAEGIYILNGKKYLRGH